MHPYSTMKPPPDSSSFDITFPDPFLIDSNFLVHIAAAAAIDVYRQMTDSHAIEKRSIRLHRSSYIVIIALYAAGMQSLPTYLPTYLYLGMYTIS